MFKLWRLHDSKESKCYSVKSYSEAGEWNRKGWGIFWTPNTFDGKRLLANLRAINFWYCEVDNIEKISQRHSVKCGAQRLRDVSSLPPSMMVETKRGYHLYWRAKPGATLDKWDDIAVRRLCPLFDADKRARDAARLLRVPGYYHLKDPKNPFLVTAVWEQDVSYSQEEMLWKFEDLQSIEDAKKAAAARKRIQDNPQGVSDDLWIRIYQMDCELALSALSGSAYVSGEQFTFRNNRNATKQILVNGKSTSCWIDQDNRIGSLDGGGPTVAQWLRWYGHPWSIVVRAIKEILL